MHIHIAADHAGFELKNALVAHLQGQGHEVTDHGAHSYDAEDDYPEFCFAAAQATVDEPGSLGIVVGGSGNGEQIAANKVTGTRSALVWSVDTAKLSRAHNDANVAGIGARQHTEEQALEIIDAFIAEPFSGAQRHQRRIDQLASYEAAR